MQSPQTVVRRFAGASLLVVLVAACGGGDDRAGQVRAVSAGSVGEDAAVGAPEGEVVLVVRGEGLRTNTDDGVAFDLAALEALPTVEVTIDDPWEKRPVVYRGVLTSELLAAAGAPATATEVKLTALDAYEVTLSAAELRSGAVVLATRADGQLLPVKDGGPTRIVFLPSSQAGNNKDLWIWSIKDMVIQ